MAEDTTRRIGLEHLASGETRIVSYEGRALLRITSDRADAEAILDRDAVAAGSLAEGYEVTAPWTPSRWYSDPEGFLALGNADIKVNTCRLIEACLAAPDRTVRLADFPQTTSFTACRWEDGRDWTGTPATIPAGESFWRASDGSSR